MLGAITAICLSAATLSPPPEAAPPDTSSVETSSTPHFGLTTVVGVPSGLGAALVLRPVPAIRIHLGGSTDFVAPGIEAGASFIPFHSWITPALTVEGGRFFSGNANPLISSVRGGTPPLSVLDRLAYDYGSAQVGIELGAPDRFVFYARGGISAIRLTSSSDAVASTAGPGVQLSLQRIDTRFVMPSATLGLLLYIL